MIQGSHLVRTLLLPEQHRALVVFDHPVIFNLACYGQFEIQAYLIIVGKSADCQEIASARRAFTVAFIDDIVLMLCQR